MMTDFKVNVDIKSYVAEQKMKLKDFFANNDRPLWIIQVGNNEASNRYIRNKIKDCKEVGLTNVEWSVFKETIFQEELIKEIKDRQDEFSGIIVQLPLPAHLSEEEIALAIPPEKDIDGFHPMSKFKPCTPTGIINFLKTRMNLDGIHAVIIGRSNIVGKPLAKMLTEENATVSLCHSHTKHLSNFCQAADLIICAVGKAKFLNCYSIHVPVVDVGINFDEDGRMVGDCFNTENRDVTPVPGGVGLLTRLALLENMTQTLPVESSELEGQCSLF